MRKTFFIACLMAVMAFAGNAKTGDFKEGTINIIHTDQFMEKFVDQEIPDLPAVIDVSAEWCGWCQKMHPHLEQLAKKYSGKIEFYQLNYETDLDLINQLGVSSYPTLIYIKANGNVVIDEQGFRTADQLDETLQEVFYAE